MNLYFNPRTVLCINFWSKKQSKKEVSTSFNMELYLRILKARGLC